MATLDFKEEEPLKVGVTFSSKAEIEKEVQQHHFAEWRVSGKPLEHPGVITWPIAIANALLTTINTIWLKLVNSGNGWGPATNSYLSWSQTTSLLFLAWIFIRLFTRHRRLRNLDRVELEPGDTAVDIAIAKNGVVLGRDIGYLRFEAGYLFFQGTSTTFSFSRQHVIGFKNRLGMNRFYLDGLSRKTDRILYRIGLDTYELGLAPIHKSDPRESASYTLGIHSWMSQQCRTDGVEVFPPTGPSPATNREVRNELAAPFFVFTLWVAEISSFNWSLPYLVLLQLIQSLFYLWLFVAFSLLPAMRIYRRYRLAKAIG